MGNLCRVCGHGVISRGADALTFAQVAAIPLTALTSWQALFDTGQLKAGQSVLIHAGAGGTGGMAIQLAKHAGATVFTMIPSGASARDRFFEALAIAALAAVKPMSPGLW